LTQDRSEESEPQPLGRPTPGEEEDPERRSSANILALFATLALVMLAYWAFDALDHSRKFQRCLDSGRSNCVGLVTPDK
jgi:ferric-dicitrate binding protein FerR (iron transport regulator)